MANDSFVQVSPDSTGKLVDCSTLTVGTNTIQRQRMVIADNVDAGNFALVTANSQLQVIESDVQNLAQSLNCTVSNAVIALGTVTGIAAVAVNISGTWTGTLVFEGMLDGTNWFSITTPSAVTANGQWHLTAIGLQNFRVRVSSTGTGTAVVSIVGSGNANVIDSFTFNTNGSLQVGIQGNAGATVDNTLGGAAPTNVIWTTQAPSTVSANALSAKTLSAVATATNIKNSAGNLFGVYLVNTSTSAGFVQFFNTSTTTTTAPVVAFPIPGSATNGGILSAQAGADVGLANFATGLAINVSTTIGGTTELTVNGTVFYK